MEPSVRVLCNSSERLSIRVQIDIIDTLAFTAYFFHSEYVHAYNMTVSHHFHNIEQLS
jgi:hypothetical protein